ncbi:hypothetical protein [Aneurinibacillus aneurinilyticus]|uniref:Uncharacterized protein n=1 Tax=Aneurinibacillus aneurinilyticus ATCC 12856 TaxID=649747 RepID=U1WY54_ANEAE|nr:hypothetical protein [Aneurinibacillus aneurinilyticus]ERI07183.1 hypothetical protein HMPREF0083_04757 [Aneurinibacillus aneurinilyticus ATCC 12856]MED0705270.1 hypothetical protein [Aneurinibacillus aneurinilyticus]MED0722482.1 hypothetical protein [Aneurinibacillus aneurinilyticus]MED0733792.1 hypothetical protein [Aneurinibacillus aneurinilyticus]MED0739687.1 hypothetical protein [Aneurinibacillus aneurinilyticus]
MGKPNKNNPNGMLFINVTPKLYVYDRTGGRNEKIIYNKPHTIDDNMVQFIRLNNDTVLVNRFTKEGKLLFSKEIKEPGNYVISKIHLQKLPKLSKEVCSLYNKLKTIYKCRFKIDVDNTIEEPYLIRLKTWVEYGRIRSRFSIKVRDDAPSQEVISEVFDLMEKSSKINLRAVIAYYHTGTSVDSLFITINEEFIDMAVEIEKQYSKMKKSEDFLKGE